MERKFSTTKIIIAALLVLFIGNVVVAIGTSTKGATLSSLEKQIRQVDDENRILTEKLITNTSLSQIMENVESLQLVTPSEIVYLTADEPVAWNHE